MSLTTGHDRQSTVKTRSSVSSLDVTVLPYHHSFSSRAWKDETFTILPWISDTSMIERQAMIAPRGRGTRSDPLGPSYPLIPSYCPYLYNKQTLIWMGYRHDQAPRRFRRSDLQAYAPERIGLYSWHGNAVVDVCRRQTGVSRCRGAWDVHDGQAGGTLNSFASLCSTFIYRKPN